MHNGVKCSELELRSVRNDFGIGTKSVRGVRSAPLCAVGPMATTRSASAGRKASTAKPFGSQLGNELDWTSPTTKD
eukprot:15441797-Alexandrium_andersonii.AAC.1